MSCTRITSGSADALRSGDPAERPLVLSLVCFQGGEDLPLRHPRSDGATMATLLASGSILSVSAGGAASALGSAPGGGAGAPRWGAGVGQI